MASNEYKLAKVNTQNSISNSDKDPISSIKSPIQQRWEIVGKIGSGGFGVIYKGNINISILI